MATLQGGVAAINAKDVSQDSLLATLQDQVHTLAAQNAAQDAEITALQSQVNALVSQNAAQGAAITALQTALGAEQLARVTADAALQTQIDAIAPAGSLSDLEIVAAESASSTDNSTSAYATCPAGKLITGGGAETQVKADRGHNNPVIERSLPATWPTATQWFAYAVRDATDEPDYWLIKVWAVCARPG